MTITLSAWLCQHCSERHLCYVTLKAVQCLKKKIKQNKKAFAKKECKAGPVPAA